jgi:hypothetical protein
VALPKYIIFLLTNFKILIILLSMEAKESIKMAYDAATMTESVWRAKYPMGAAYETWRKAYFNKCGVGNMAVIRSDLPVADYVPMMYNAS